MVSRQSVQESYSVLFASFCERSASTFMTALSEAHARVKDGMNAGDIGALFRLIPITELPGLLTSHGTVVADTDHPDTPKNTTRIRIPHRDGESFAIVYCLKRIGDRQYKLSKREVYSLSDFQPSDRLLDLPPEDLKHIVIGISYTPRRQDGSRGFSVRLLGGTIDFEKRVLFAEFEELIIAFSAPGGQTVPSTSSVPTGPQPTLTPRTRQV